MLAKVGLKTRRFSEYRGMVSDTLFNEVTELAEKLKGKRILIVNATADGGGVAEILRAEVPLLRDLGIEAEWHVLRPRKGFFEITKHIHNGLQGDGYKLKTSDWQLYESYNRDLAAAIKPDDWDVVFIHDPQPAASLSFLDQKAKSKWIWRCHIDSKHAKPDYLRHFLNYLELYDGAIFTMEKFVLTGYKPKKLAVTPMAIDPLSEKNQDMKRAEAISIVQGLGIDVSKPLAVQVSRFDPWKDPLGVIAAWKLATKEVPALQLAMVGDTAGDDPEGVVILEQVEKLAAGEKNLFIIANKADDRAVKGLQKAANVVIQKSIREGFGLTVTEALWAGTPVIGSDVGGIPLQIEDGINGFLVNNAGECAERIVDLVKNPTMADEMGEAGHALVKQKYLLPRLIRDDLKFIVEVLGEV